MYTYTYPIQPTNTTQHTSLNTSSVLARENRTELCFRSDHEKNSFLLLLPPSFSSQPTNHLSSLLSISPKKKKTRIRSQLASRGWTQPSLAFRTNKEQHADSSIRERGNPFHSVLFYSCPNELIPVCISGYLSSAGSTSYAKKERKKSAIHAPPNANEM